MKITIIKIPSAENVSCEFGFSSIVEKIEIIPIKYGIIEIIVMTVWMIMYMIKVEPTMAQNSLKMYPKAFFIELKKPLSLLIYS